eukprot:7263130-Prymnesium_polylepis.1
MVGPTPTLPPPAPPPAPSSAPPPAPPPAPRPPRGPSSSSTVDRWSSPCCNEDARRRHRPARWQPNTSVSSWSRRG